MCQIVIVGAGAVGANAALFLDALGHEVTLIEAAAGILQGSPAASFINHGDGFEYYKPHHRRTGYLCVDGATTKALLYPLSLIRTGMANPDSPLRFLLANQTTLSKEVQWEDFFANAMAMKDHFARKFEAIRATRGWSRDHAGTVFLRSPDNFVRELRAEEYEDIADVAAGCAGSSFGVNMPHYVAILLAAIRRSRIRLVLGCDIEGVEKIGDNYTVLANGLRYSADQVLICASHRSPQIASGIRGSSFADVCQGTYFLNSMTLLKLPATSDHYISKAACRINFTLQQQHGGMYACLVPPSEDSPGAAAIYYPHREGSQRFSHPVRTRSDVAPEAWDEFIREGLPADDNNVRRTFGQACSLYPFLRDYAEIDSTICRTVFNPATVDSHGGSERRVREISLSNTSVTSDGLVSIWSAPKWTNAELVALLATDYVQKKSAGQRLPRDVKSGLGPTLLDVARISETINVRNVRPSAVDALEYAGDTGLPVAMVQAELLDESTL